MSVKQLVNKDFPFNIFLGCSPTITVSIIDSSCNIEPSIVLLHSHVLLRKQVKPFSSPAMLVTKQNKYLNSLYCLNIGTLSCKSF